MAALAGMGVGGAAGGITGALIGRGFPNTWRSAMKGGAEMEDSLSAHSDNVDWTRRAKEILERTGAQDISSSAEASAEYAQKRQAGRPHGQRCGRQFTSGRKQGRTRGSPDRTGLLSPVRAGSAI